MECQTFGIMDLIEDDPIDFRTSLLTAARNSRMNRDRLRNNLIKSNILQ